MHGAAKSESGKRRHFTRRQFGAMAGATVTAPFIPHAAKAATPAASLAASPVSPSATPTASGPQLTVTPTTVSLDEPFSVVITGLTAGRKVSVSSTITDIAKNEWAATAYWDVRDAQLDLAMEPPAGGSYAVPDPMGLIWAATSSGPYYVPPVSGTETVVITATIDGRQIGQATVERGLSLADGQPTYVYNDRMVADYWAPAPGSATLAPAVIVLGGSEGWPSYGADLTAAMLASHGYAALALAYFGPVGHLPRTLENVPLEYFGPAIEWLKQQPSVRKDRIGVIGYSRGGELALLLGAYYSELTAVVSFSGSGYAVASPTALDQPAWTWRGKPLPYLVAARNNTDADLARAEIPVERTNDPILMVSGEGDRLWPSTWLTSAAWDRLQRTHHPWPDQFLRYPGAGHAILPPYQPMAPLVAPEFGGDPLSNQIAGVNSWQAMLHLLEERLRD